jgi:hypothetical protein
MGFGEDALDVTDGESLADLVAGWRDLDEFGDVARDNLVTLSVAQGVAEDSVNVLNLSG